ncbi:MAG: iron-sulfur cluster assembly accessory protein [Cyanobacteria bacterium SBLK]|nr:iron-sulfur cluster assembly accessory protein [Cyanobacteria bacterium SBLK]
MIVLSQAAAHEIRRLQATCDNPDGQFRLSAKAGGCAGFYYVLAFAESVESSDRRYESEGIIIVVDEESDRYISGLKLDYSQDLMGGGFRFHNPNAVKTCNCGNSFAIDIGT